MPALLICRIFKVILKLQNEIGCVGIIINKQSRSISKINIRSYEALGTEYGAVPNWRVNSRIDSQCFSIPSVNSVFVFLEDFDNFLSFLFSPDDGGTFRWNEILHSLIHSRLSHFVQYAGIRHLPLRCSDIDIFRPFHAFLEFWHISIRLSLLYRYFFPLNILALFSPCLDDFGLNYILRLVPHLIPLYRGLPQITGGTA